MSLQVHPDEFDAVLIDAALDAVLIAKFVDATFAAILIATFDASFGSNFSSSQQFVEADTNFVSSSPQVNLKFSRYQFTYRCTVRLQHKLMRASLCVGEWVV